MKLLSAVLPRVRRLLPSADRGVALGVLTALLTLEVLGRQATSELHDAVAGTALLAIALFVASWHRSQPLTWVDKLAGLVARLVARVERLKYDVGVDFRGSPPVRSRLPRGVSVGFLVLLGWTAAAAAAWHAFPDEGWRRVGLASSYLLYLVVLMLVWAGLSGCFLAGVYLPVVVVDQRMRAASGQPPNGRPDGVVVAGYAVAAALVAWLTPPVYGLAVCGLAAGFAAFVAAGRGADDAAFLWRATAPGPVYRVPLRRAVAIAGAFLAGTVFALLLTACGGRLLAAPAIDAPMPLTGFLGAVVAWLVPGVVLTAAVQLWQFRRTDPTRRTPPTILVHGRPADVLGAVRKLVRWGFRSRPALRKPTPAHEPSATPVAVRVVRDGQSEAKEFDPRWPLAVTAADLTDPVVKDRLQRRDEIHLRRQFYRGLNRLLKTAAASVPAPGGAFLFAPHWWFVWSLIWEEPGRSDPDADGQRPVGPGYRRVFAPRVRQHLHQLFRAVEVDLIYIEHGISAKNVERVMRTVTEVYDRHAGGRRVEDHHFRGLTKVRVMLHDYAPGNPFHSDTYPEPKFDDVSRARVLHIYKDRSESEEEARPPFDFSWEPTPLGIG